MPCPYVCKVCSSQEELKQPECKMGPICYGCVYKLLGFDDEKYEYEEIERGGYNLECPCCGGDHLLRVREGGDIMMPDFDEKYLVDLPVIWSRKVCENMWEKFPVEES